jgi:Family of unknown function (DUF6159)
MPGTFSDSWKLTKTAFRLIAEDRALLIFPVVAGLSILAALVLFVLGAFWVLPGASSGSGSAGTYQLLGVLLFLAFYFAAVWISVYATAALIGAATLKLSGQQPTAADGWRVARGRIGKLTLWAFVAATVGLLIQAISRRVGGVGGAVIGLVGGASWSVATYFVVPVLLYENESTWRSLTRSARIFLNTFGRSLVSNIVVGLIVAAGVVVGVVLGIVGLLVLFGGSTVVGLVLIVAAVAVVVLVALIGAAAEGILRAALYRYAVTGKIDPDLLPSAYQGAAPRAPSTPLV